jgi:stringent starvation protein B
VAVVVLAVLVLVRSGVRFGTQFWAEAQNLAHAREKRLRFDGLYYKEGSVTIHLDARRAGVKLPARYLTEPNFVLQYARHMPNKPISDFRTTDRDVTATFTFDGQAHATSIPWSAVYVIADRTGSGRWYREDTPPESWARMKEGATGAR